MEQSDIKRLITLCLVVGLTACSDYLPIASGKLSGIVSTAPANWGELLATEVIQLESMGDAPYSVNLWVAEVAGTPHVFAGDNRTQWVENIAGNPNVRLKIGESIYELRAIRVTDAARFEAFARAWETKYGNRPQNENVDETYLFRLEPRQD